MATKGRVEVIVEGVTSGDPTESGGPSKVSGQRRVCGARKRDGSACQTIPMANGRCRLHGGASLTGTAHPNFKNGRYSRYLPKDIRSRYDEAMRDPDLISLRDELGLLTARITDQLSKLEKSESPPWGEALTAFEDMAKAKDETVRDRARKTLEEVLRRGRDADTVQRRVWAEVRELTQEKSRVAAIEWKRLNDVNGTITVEQALLFAKAFMEAARETIKDRAVLQALHTKTLEIMPPEEISP